MTVVVSLYDGQIFDNAVPRFFPAGSGLVYDRLTAKMLSQASIYAIGAYSEVGAVPAALADAFDFPGEGSNPMFMFGYTVDATVNAGIAITGGPSNNAGGAFATLTFVNGVRRTVKAAVTVGLTTTGFATRLATAIDTIAEVSTATSTANTVTIVGTVGISAIQVTPQGSVPMMAEPEQAAAQTAPEIAAPTKAAKKEGKA